MAIIGTVGVPACYGGFETLAERLVRFHHDQRRPEPLTVYCSRLAYPSGPSAYLSARLRYLRLDANGPQSILYDAVALVQAARRRTDALIVLGVSGAVAMPLVRLVSRARIITNIDGIEWRREKWRGLARHILRWSERIAVRWSHEVIADNEAIADYVRRTYGRAAHVVEYGGDHAVGAHGPDPVTHGLPPGYALALCRIEPENNVAMILEAFSRSGRPLVFVGNWDKSDYGRRLRDRYERHPNLRLLDPIYDEGPLRAIRSAASLYVHGHSAGGTNPSLVEMMHFGTPVLAFDCVFNRHTTEGAAAFFGDAASLERLVGAATAEDLTANGTAMRAIASRRYTWDRICRRYFDLAAMGDRTEAGRAGVP